MDAATPIRRPPLVLVPRAGHVLTVLLLAVLFGLPLSLHGQAVTLIVGRVTGPGGTPLAGARLQVTADRGQSAETRTDSAGRYRLSVAGRGSAFVVSAEAAGLNAVTRLLSRPLGSDVELTLDLSLTRAVPLQALVVRVPRLTVASANTRAGSVAQDREGLELRKEPLGSDDFSDLARREVGVARTATPDGPGISIGGEPPDQTRLTLDGGDVPQGVIPREAIREVNVLTNTYDVSRGRFTGGQMDVRTQAAGNEWGASLRVDGRDPHLQFGDAPSALRQRTTQFALDGGGGGALSRDRVFGYAAGTFRRSASPGLGLASLDPSGLRAIGVDADSVARFLDLTRGLRPALGEPRRQGSTLASGLLRLDAALSPRHSLMLRFNGQTSRFSDGGFGWAVAGTESELRSSQAGVFALLSSGGSRLANELRLNLSGAAKTWLLRDPAPEGLVNVTSGADGTTATLRFAGSPSGSDDTRQRAFELAEQVVLTNQDRTHRLRAGGEMVEQDLRTLPRISSGSFFFSSLADLQAGRPALFARQFAGEERSTPVRRVAVFADESWRPGRASLSYGARAERVWFLDSPAVNPLVETRFGQAPGVLPSRWLVSPRVGLSFIRRMPWDGKQGESEIKAGIGDFVGALPLAAFGTAFGENGLAEAAELICAGPAAPIPDWAAYRAGRGALPATCADGSPAFASSLPNATIFAPGFGPPRVRRASVGAHGALPSGIIWQLNASASRGVHQPVAFDRNLREAPAFTNAAEAGRPVFVAADAIDPATGAVSFSSSRRFSDLGTVREVTAEGRSRALQASASGSQQIRSLFITLGYTWTDARASVGPLDVPGGNGASTDGSPSRLAWAPSPYSPRHQFQFQADWLRTPSFSLGVTAQLSSGVPFTPMVAGDVNGDGASNDRAYVIDPASVDDAAAGAMGQLLAEAPANAGHCLHAQLGRIAAHNSCWTGWAPSLDAHARFQLGPRVPGAPQKRVTVWLAARNVTAGLDYLLHGPEQLRGWGQLAAVDNTLLYVRGFDPAARRFRYEVNPSFGGTPRDGLLHRTPFAISIQARVALGNDRVVSQFVREMAANGNQELAPHRLRDYLQRQLPSVPAEVLALNGPNRLYLTPDQAAKLQAAGDSLQPRRSAIVDEIVEITTGARRFSSPAIRRVRDLRAQAVALRQAGADAARGLLTPEQWMRLPATLRAPGTEFSTLPPQVITSGDP